MAEADDILEDDEDVDSPLAAEDDKLDKPTMSTASAEERDTKDKESTFLEIASFLKKYNPPPSLHGRPDTLEERYTVQPNRLVNEFSKDLAIACEAVDNNLRERQLFAMVMQKDLPYRLRCMEELVGVDHPNILPLVAAGSVQYSHDDAHRMTAVYEYPQGKPLAEIIKEDRSYFTEQYIIDEIIAPLGDALKLFKGKGIAHGSINLDTVFFGDRVQLGECVSEPCGYAQHTYFESPERSQALPLGKGEATPASDCYALGILVLHILFGQSHFDRIDKREYLSKRLSLGSYNTLVGGKEMKGLEDFLKGVLTDDQNERWTPDHIDQWVRGKKYNLLTPSVLREGQRPFQFLGEDYYNRRSLASSIYQNWEEAKTALRNNHLSRWVEVSLHKNDMATAIRTVMEKTGGIHSISEKANNELVARTICLLDPEGPVRYKQISSYVDGLGVLLADAFRKRDQKSIQACVEMLDYNFYNYMNELLDGAKTKRHGNLLWRMQNCSRYLRMPAMGFGIERILYELTPELACQSPLIADDNVLTMEELLHALDRLGVRKSKSFEYLDRHIAAFAAMRLDITKEVKIVELKRIPALAQNPQLIVLYLLAQAQRKAGKPKLRGLTSWASLRVVPLIDNFHSRTIRRKIRSGLKSAAKSGELDKIFDLLMDQSMVQEDYSGFNNAVHRFTKNGKQIVKLENSKRRQSRADQLGMVLSMIVGYSTLLITTSVVLKRFFFGY